MTDCYLGIDAGGTQIRSAAVSVNGDLLSSLHSIPTGTKFDPQALRGFVASSIEGIKNEVPDAVIKAVGMGITGLVKVNRVVGSDFLPLLNEINLVELLSEVSGTPAALENDARCFILGEARFGAGKGFSNVTGITLGTGVGGAIIANGQLLHGARNNAGEVWEIPLRGKWLEYFVSTGGLVRTYGELGGKEPVTGAAEIAVLARNGDSSALAAFRSFAADVWSLCETYRAIIDPDIVVIGGSIAQARDVFGEDFQANVAKGTPRIGWAELGGEAGLIGAASIMM